jgi:Na+/proline symporter
MKIRTNKKILLTSGIGLLSVLLGALVFRFQADNNALSFVGINLIGFGLFIFIAALYAATTAKPETERVADERVTRINEKAGYTAGWLIMLSVMLMFWADKIWSLNLELKDMYWTTLLVGTDSWLILRWYYNRRGEVV